MGRKTPFVKLIICALVALLAFCCGQMSVRPPAIYDSAPSMDETFPESSDTEAARDIARRYLACGAYSKEGLISALVAYEHFSDKAAREAVGSLDIDWQEQAEKEVNAYLHMDGVSEKKLREYMKRDLFTKKQTDIAIKRTAPDWKDQARRKAETLKEAGVGSISIKTSLLSAGFTEHDIEGLD